MATNWGLTVDCTSASTMAAFWKEALGYTDAPPPEGFASWRDWLTACEVPEDEWDDGATIVDPDGVRPGIGFLKVPEGKTVKNRLHLDVRVAGGRHLPPEVRTPRIRTTVDRLVAAGATVLAEHTLVATSTTSSWPIRRATSSASSEVATRSARVSVSVSAMIQG